MNVPQELANTIVDPAAYAAGAPVDEAFTWFATALRERPADEDLIRSVLVSLGSAPTDPLLLAEIARLRAELLSWERIEKVFRGRQGAMAREVRALLVGRGVPDLDAAVRAEAVAGAVFAALAVWTEGPPPHDLGQGRPGPARLTALERRAQQRAAVDHQGVAGDEPGLVGGAHVPLTERGQNEHGGHQRHQRRAAPTASLRRGAHAEGTSRAGRRAPSAWA